MNSRLSCHQSSRGRLDPSIAVPPILKRPPPFFKRPARSPNCRATISSRGRLNPLIAEPPFFKRPARSVDCRATISHKAGSIPQLPRNHFSRGRRYFQIAVPPFFKAPYQSMSMDQDLYSLFGPHYLLPQRDASGKLVSLDITSDHPTTD